MKFYQGVSVALLMFVVTIGAANAQGRIAGAKKVRTLIIFFDGLRPDYITPELMPNVDAFRKTGSYGNNHHSIFPTVTRVNASSYATGSYPAHHGILGNTILIPALSATNTINTSDAAALLLADKKLNGNLLTALSLGEILRDNGQSFMVFSSGSSGQALLQNHSINGLVVNPALILPESKVAVVTDAIGIAPAEAVPNTAQHVWATDALLHFALNGDGPAVSAVWYSDPDASAHEKGMGSEEANTAIREVDRQFGRIIDALTSRNLRDSFNIIISADHGFVTYAGKENLSDFLIAQGLKKGTDADDVVLAAGAIFVKGHDATKVKAIVSALQRQPWIGAIFTRGGKTNLDRGWVDGTLSFESIYWNHPDRVADILVDVNWDDRANDKGYGGTSFSRGVAGHGSASPYEIHIPLIASGPSFKRGYTSSVPTANVDLIPTILFLHQIAVPLSIDGRVMSELLSNSKATPAVSTETIKVETKFKEGSYKLALERSTVGSYKYVNFTKVERTVRKP